MAKIKNSVGPINVKITLACLVGIALSYYAYVVETTKEIDDSYVAMCDISERVSCSKAFMSEYGKGFGLIPSDSILYLPNSIYGLVFYALIAVLSMFNNYATSVAILTLGVLSNIGTVYLASILYLLNDICVVCVSTYVINAIILILSIKKYRKLFRNGTNKKKLH